MTILLATHPGCLGHQPGSWHPERPARLSAVLEGIEGAGLGAAVAPFEPRRATPDEVARAHAPGHLAALEALVASGGGQIDPDTVVSPGSLDAALLAAGAGLEAVERLAAGQGDAAFCAVRPPGHHATPTRAMGFCLLNHVAIAAAALAERGERVLVVDWDAHHGNGTQEAFWSDPRVAYASLHEHPLFPGTGAWDEVGGAGAEGLTCNVPLPAGATGDVYRLAFDELLAPLAEAFAPTWVLVSAGYDAHRADPLAGLALTAGDFGDLAAAVAGLAPPGRLVLFLEGGYDLDALADSAAATVAALAALPRRGERPSAGGPGREAVAAARRLRDEHGWP